MTATLPAYTKKDFQTDQEVRWCPGCGDYAILSAVQQVFPELGIPREKFVVVSGIGCSSRFPYYMNTFGFHTIHGRAPAVATGIKIARPDLEVWIATGDGDALSIGGNHTIHMLRRNVGIKVLLFNNKIYGLTKGQYSPTSEIGKKAKSTPYGSLDRPFNPLSLALGAEATFVARSVDVFLPHQKAVLRKAAAHKGTAFVEILQNCNIFNDGAWENLTEKELRDDHTIAVEHGQPLVFGKAKDKRHPHERPRARGRQARERHHREGPDRPRRAPPEPGLRVPALAHGRDARLPDAARRAARRGRADLREADRRPARRGRGEEGQGRSREAAARRRHLGSPASADAVSRISAY